MASLGQRAVRGYQAGDRLDQFVRAGLEDGIELREATAGLRELMVFQVHPGQRHECCGVGVQGRRPLPATRAGSCRLLGQHRGAAQLAAQGLGQREMSEAGGPFGFTTRCGCGGDTRIEDAYRLIEVARPQLHGPASGQHAGLDSRISGEPAAGGLACQGLGAGGGLRRRAEVPAATSNGEADHRGGEPGRGLVVGGKPLEDVLGRVQPGDGRLKPACRQRDRGADQVRPRFGPGLAVRHAGERVGRRRATHRLDDLADRQPVDDDVGGELPVAALGGVSPTRR